MLTRHQVTFCVTYYAVGSACVLIATASYPDTSPFFFFLPMVHCASTRVYRVSRSPLCEYEATEQGEAEKTLYFK